MQIISPLGETSLQSWILPGFVAAAFDQDGVLRLSIARSEDEDLPMSWEELMQVKRDCGFGDNDACEVYPADRFIINTGNIRHLYFVNASFILRNPPGLLSSNPAE